MSDQKQDEIQEERESYQTKPVGIDMCSTHTKDNWTDHRGYVQEEDGTIVCSFCPWGTLVPGFYRVVDGRVIDLRHISRGQ